jgi:hypothetical protein
MNRRFLLNSLFLLPFSSGCSLDIKDILGETPKTPNHVIPEWPFRAIPLSPIQQIMWGDYHKFPNNIFIRETGSEKMMPEKISELYIGELREITTSGVRFCGKREEVIIDNLDFNNHPIDDPLWQGIFLEEFPEKFAKVTIFTSVTFPNHKFLQSLSDGGKFNVKVFSLDDPPKTNSKMIRV